MENPEPLATMDTRHRTKTNKAKYERSRLRSTHHQCLDNYQLTIYDNEIVICDMNYYLLCLIRGNPCLSFHNYFFFLLFTKSNVIKKATSHSGALEFTRGFCGSRDVYYLVVCVVFCRSLFALSLSIYDFWLPISLIHDKL
jgi:hypothetical protein